MRAWIVSLILLCNVSLTFAQAAYKEVAALKGGAIRGTVRFAGNSSAQRNLEITQDAGTCGERKVLPALLTGKNQGVQNSIVSLEGIKQGKTWTKEPVLVLDQQKCEYVPHVMIAPVGSQIEILNSDDILHNVHSYEYTGEMKTLFNIAQPIKGLRTKLELEKPGTLLATCDAGHPWMSAFVRVADHPYVVITDKDGNFLMENVPAGTHTISMWHEPITVLTEKRAAQLQQRHFDKPILIQQKVTVMEGATATVSFEFQ